MNKIIYILILCLLFSSCEGIKEGTGIVLDDSTSLPLEGVLAVSYVKEVKDNNMKSSITTDSTGMFNGSTGLVGLIGNVDKLNLFIVLSKDSFMSQTIVNPDRDTVRLQRK